MIRTFYQDDIINHLAAIFTYGLSKQYSYKAIEEHIISSTFINALENNEYDINHKTKKIVENTYGINNVKDIDISYIGLFLAESYFKLFIDFNKSFEYIFLYWPLEHFINRYDIYHEMDYSAIKNDFIVSVKETTLIKKIAKDRGIRLIDIPRLTGINRHTINKYVSDDKYLYNSSFITIYRLATLFNVKPNLFINSIGVFLDSSIYLDDDRYLHFRHYLALFFICYYDYRIKEKYFKFDYLNHYLINNDNIKIKVIIDDVNNLVASRIKKEVNDKTYLVIIPTSFFGDITSFKYLKDIEAYDIAVLTQQYIYITKLNKKKEITDTIFRSLYIRAKSYIVI